MMLAHIGVVPFEEFLTPVAVYAAASAVTLLGAMRWKRRKNS